MSDQTEKAPEMSGEQAADFARMNAMAADEGAQLQAGDPVTEQEKPGLRLSEELSGLLMMAVKAAGPMFPSLAAIYTDEVIASVGVALQPVCDKHGWLQGGIGGKYGEEIMALIVIGPLAYATYAGIAGDIAARSPSKPSEQLAGPLRAPGLEAAAPSDRPGSDTVTVGAVIQ